MGVVQIWKTRDRFEEVGNFVVLAGLKQAGMKERKCSSLEQVQEAKEALTTYYLSSTCVLVAGLPPSFSACKLK